MPVLGVPLLPKLSDDLTRVGVDKIGWDREKGSYTFILACVAISGGPHVRQARQTVRFASPKI